VPSAIYENVCMGRRNFNVYFARVLKKMLLRSKKKKKKKEEL